MREMLKALMKTCKHPSHSNDRCPDCHDSWGSD